MKIKGKKKTKYKHNNTTPNEQKEMKYNGIDTPYVINKMKKKIAGFRALCVSFETFFDLLLLYAS